MRSINLWITIIVCSLVVWQASSQLIHYYREVFPGDFVPNHASWGAFGDYFGGIMNPILGLLNLAVLIFISYLVSRSDREQALYSLRHDAIRECIKLFSKIEALADKTDRPSRMKLLEYFAKLDAFFRLNVHLFPFLKTQDTEQLRQLCSQIAGTAQDLEAFGEAAMTSEEAAATTAHFERWGAFANVKNSIILKMQKHF